MRRLWVRIRPRPRQVLQNRGDVGPTRWVTKCKLIQENHGILAITRATSKKWTVNIRRNQASSSSKETWPIQVGYLQANTYPHLHQQVFRSAFWRKRALQRPIQIIRRSKRS